MADLVVVLVFRVILTQIFTFNIFEEKYKCFFFFFFQTVLRFDRTFLMIFFKELIFSLVSMLKPFFVKSLTKLLIQNGYHTNLKTTYALASADST